MATPNPNTPVSIGNARGYSIDKNICSIEYYIDEELKKLFPSLSAERGYKKGVGRTGGLPGYIEQETFKEKLFKVVFIAWNYAEREKAVSLNGDYYKTFKKWLINEADDTDWYISKNKMEESQLREGALVYTKAAGIDALGFVVGPVLGKNLKCVSKNTKMLVKGKNVTIQQKVYKEQPQVGISVTIDRNANKWMGRKVEDLFSNPKRFYDGRSRVNTKIDIDLNRDEILFYSTYKYMSDSVKNAPNSTHTQPFSYGDIMGNAADYATDYIPIVGNVKSAESAISNTVLAVNSLRLASSVEKNNMINEKSRLEYGNYIKNLIIHDIKNMNTTQMNRLIDIFR